jgi:transposase InsO family protein
MAQGSERPRRKRLSWESRCEVVAAIEQGASPPLAAASGGCSRATAYRLWRRYCEGGWAALRDRASTPRRQPRRLSAEAGAADRRDAPPHRVRASATGGACAAPALDEWQGAAPARLLAPAASGRSRRPLRAPLRARAAGELLHVDTTQLGRFWEPGKRTLGAAAGRPHRHRRIGWQHLHVAIDDHSRLAYAEVLAGRDADSCARFLSRALAWYAERGVAVERVLTDNAKAYHARAWLEATRQLGIERRHTRSYRPRTNGKAERFIQTLLAEWASARSYPFQHRPSSSARRLLALVQQTPPAQPARGAAADQSRLTPQCHDS